MQLFFMKYNKKIIHQSFPNLQRLLGSANNIILRGF